MARTFQTLSLRVPLRTTWEESWQLLQSEGGDPVDLTGYSARMQLRETLEDVEPVAEFDSGDEIAIAAATGTITLTVSAAAVAALSPDNERRTLLWDIELYIPAGAEPEYVIPLFTGKVTLLPRVTQV